MSKIIDFARLMAASISPEEGEAKPNPNEILDAWKNPQAVIEQVDHTRGNIDINVLGAMKYQDQNNYGDLEEVEGEGNSSESIAVMKGLMKEKGIEIDELEEAQVLLQQIIEANDGRIPTDIDKFIRLARELSGESEEGDEFNKDQLLNNHKIKRALQRIEELGNVSEEDLANFSSEKAERILTDLDYAINDLIAILEGHRVSETDSQLKGPHEGRSFLKNPHVFVAQEGPKWMAAILLAFFLWKSTVLGGKLLDLGFNFLHPSNRQRNNQERYYTSRVNSSAQQAENSTDEPGDTGDERDSPIGPTTVENQISQEEQEKIVNDVLDFWQKNRQGYGLLPESLEQYGYFLSFAVVNLPDNYEHEYKGLRAYMFDLLSQTGAREKFFSEDRIEAVRNCNAYREGLENENGDVLYGAILNFAHGKALSAYGTKKKV